MDDLAGLDPEPLPTTPAAVPAPQPTQLGQPWGALAMLPLILARAGQGGAAAFLKGMQDARQGRTERQDTLNQRDFQNRRLVANDEAQAADRQATADYRAAQLKAAEQTRLRQLVDQFQQAMANAESAEEVNATLGLYQQAGLDPQQASSYALQTVTPSKLEQNQARKVLARILDTYKGNPDALAQLEASGALFEGPDGQKRPLGEWRVRAGGGAVDAQGQPMLAPGKINPSNPGSFEDYTARYAADRGKTVQALTAADIEDARKRYMQADDRPRVTVNAPREITPTARANVIGSRRNQWQRFAKAVTDRELAVAKVDAGLGALDRGNRNAATQAIILAFNKLQDETSVVREGEYARSEDLAPITNRIEAFFTKLTQGGGALTDRDLRALAAEAKATAQALGAISNRAAADLRQGIEEELADYGIPASRVFGGSRVGVREPVPDVGKPLTPAAAPTTRQRIGRFDVEVTP